MRYAYQPTSSVLYVGRIRRSRRIRHNYARFVNTQPSRSPFVIDGFCCSRYTVVCAGCVLAITLPPVPNNVPEPDGAAHQIHFQPADNQVGAVSGGNAVILQIQRLALWWVIKFRPSLICP